MKLLGVRAVDCFDVLEVLIYTIVGPHSSD